MPTWMVLETPQTDPLPHVDHVIRRGRKAHGLTAYGAACAASEGQRDTDTLDPFYVSVADETTREVFHFVATLTVRVDVAMHRV